MLVDGDCQAADTGELQLTNYGISGIPVFQISRFAAKALKEKKLVEAEIDFKDINDNQKHYLSIILESLKSISYTYGVKIPMNEALYIYDYINEFLNDSDIAV